MDQCLELGTHIARPYWSSVLIAGKLAVAQPSAGDQVLFQNRTDFHYRKIRISLPHFSMLKLHVEYQTVS
jgi:hypothetical protein